MDAIDTSPEVRPDQESAGERDAEEGIPGYGQAPPGVRTTRLEAPEEHLWPEKVADSPDEGASSGRGPPY
jgi:hypothetical protein